MDTRMSGVSSHRSAETAFVPRLYYFNFAGKAEAMRLLCAYAGIEIEDIRLPSTEEVKPMREAGKLPFGQVPVLEVAEGAFIGQSAAIMRYLGKQAGLYPQDGLTAALVDSIMDEEADLFVGPAVYIYGERYGFEGFKDYPELLSSALHSLNTDILPRHLLYMENFAKASTTGWIANTEGPTIADFIVCTRLAWLTSGVSGISTELLVPCPGLRTIIDRFNALPEIVAYYSKRNAVSS